MKKCDYCGCDIVDKQWLELGLCPCCGYCLDTDDLDIANMQERDTFPDAISSVPLYWDTPYIPNKPKAYEHIAYKDKFTTKMLIILALEFIIPCALIYILTATDLLEGFVSNV